MSCPRHRIASFHVPRNTSVLFPTRMSAYVLVPQLRERKRISARRKRKRPLRRERFPRRSLSFASFGELLVIDFPQSELEASNGGGPGSPRAIKFFVQAKRPLRLGRALFTPAPLKNTYHTAVCFFTLLNYSF